MSSNREARRRQAIVEILTDAIDESEGRTSSARSTATAVC